MPERDANQPAEERGDIDRIKDAFGEVIGYLHAYRSGAPAEPELAWAIRNFNEVCEDVRGDQESRVDGDA